MTTDTPPRRKWHFNRWLIVFIVFIVAMLGWSGWRAYAFRSALSQAKALGWSVDYTDPVETIPKNWKAAFAKETWMDGVTSVAIPTGEAFEQHLAIVHRLNPKGLSIDKALTLRDLSALKPLDRLQWFGLHGGKRLTNVDGLKNLSALQSVTLHGCTELTNVDALKNLSALKGVVLLDCTALTNMDTLKNLSALQIVTLEGCTGLTNVDALMNLSALQYVSFFGCMGVPKESVAALRAALPKAEIIDP